jgi:hypothetical protein
MLSFMPYQRHSEQHNGRTTERREKKKRALHYTVLGKYLCGYLVVYRYNKRYKTDKTEVYQKKSVK